MITFEVDDMSCGHCVSSITKAVKAADSGADVRIELATHRVWIAPDQATTQQLEDAIRDAGFSPRAA